MRNKDDTVFDYEKHDHDDVRTYQQRHQAVEFRGRLQQFRGELLRLRNPHPRPPRKNLAPGKIRSELLRRGMKLKKKITLI